MPRGKKRTTQSGDDAQNIGSVPGQRYGEGVEQQAMQRAMPAPDRSGTPTPAAAATPPPAAAPAPMDPTALSAALGQAPLGLLSGGSQLPDQPVTAGLSRGPGGGPEMLGALRARTPLARTLDTLYRRTGDPKFREMARKAGM